MLKQTPVSVAVGLLLAVGLSAQEPKPAPQTPQKTEPQSESAARKENQPINVRVDLTITDQIGPGEPGKRTVSMIVADGHDGSVRSGGSVMVEGNTASAVQVPGSNRINVTLNVDAHPIVLSDNRIRLRLSLEYAPRPETQNAASREGRPHLIERLTLIVTPGKPMVISQASDPTSDRKIVVELLATILK